MSLREQYFLHLVSHVMEYSPQELALLPVYHWHTLLRMVAPVHHYYLEQTAVANQIDTDAIWPWWKELPRDVRFYTWNPFMKLHLYEDCLGAQYIAYVWHLLLGMFRHSQLNCRNNLVKMMFATHTSIFKDSLVPRPRGRRKDVFPPPTQPGNEATLKMVPSS